KTGRIAARAPTRERHKREGNRTMSRRRPFTRFARSNRLRAATSPIVERLEDRRLLSVAAQIDGALNGKVLYTSGGHGYVWRNGSPGSWGLMRPDTNNVVEDMGNQDQLLPYADYALHAGATVVSMRPLG